MKKIHILPTDKPSRLVLDDTTQHLMLINKGEALWGNQNIYITSDEEIKDGDWCIVDGGLGRVGVDKFQSNVRYSVTPIKIILTTDLDLIADGVQSIDDSFLEWFVNNPSCEYVSFITTTISNKSLYKTNIGFESWKKEEPKQETLEEAAEKYIETSHYMNNDRKDDIIFGAKWQQERMYSEEDMKQAFKNGSWVASWSDMGIEMKYDNFETWFEQFKK
jgi:hypothetical protein